MSDFLVFPRMKSTFPVGSTVQLKADKGRVGRHRVGEVIGHRIDRVVVRFLTDPGTLVDCRPKDLEDPSSEYVTETPMNVILDTLDDLKLQFIEQ